MINTYHFQNAVVRVHRPELTEDERNRRMQLIYNAAMDLLKHTQGVKNNEEKIK